VFYPDGGRLQASQPHALFQFCTHWFGAKIEAFASPFNRNTSYPLYYSAFPDVDAPFGSCGSFFDAPLPQGV
jgi:phosphorylated CTD-interacting factor 1